MFTLTEFTVWVYQPQLWIIAGILLILLELMDGTQIFFLPMGLGSLFMALWIYLFNDGALPHTWLSPNWYFVFLHWAVMALVLALALTSWRRSRRQKAQPQDTDVNDY